MRKVEVNIPVNVTPGTVIRAFTDPDMLRGWWGVERAFVEKRPGGIYTLAWNITERGFGFISAGTVKNYEPGGLLEIGNFVYMNPAKPLLGPMTLTVSATEAGGQTMLYLCQDGYGEGVDWDWYYEAVSQAWPVVAQTLKKYLEGEK